MKKRLILIMSALMILSSTAVNAQTINTFKCTTTTNKIVLPVKINNCWFNKLCNLKFTIKPTVTTTTYPSPTPTVAPTATPTEVPTEAPTAVPTETPTPESTAVPTAEPTATPATRSVEITQYESEVLELVNEERAANGLKALTYNTELAKVAKAHSEDMASNNYFSHTNLEGLSPFDRMKNSGISYMYAAENIAAGQKTPEDVMNAWMNSSGHRANILNANVTQMGLGYAEGGSYGCYWTQDFIG